MGTNFLWRIFLDGFLLLCSSYYDGYYWKYLCSVCMWNCKIGGVAKLVLWWILLKENFFKMTKELTKPSWCVIFFLSMNYFFHLFLFSLETYMMFYYLGCHGLGPLTLFSTCVLCYQYHIKTAKLTLKAAQCSAAPLFHIKTVEAKIKKNSYCNVISWGFIET